MTKVQIAECGDGWSVTGETTAVGHYATAAEAEQAVRAAAIPGASVVEGMTVIEWTPISRVGWIVVRAIAS